MVTTMIERKDPHQENSKADPSDDDLIIELTDEIIMKSEDDTDIFELDDDRTGVFQTNEDVLEKTDDKDPASEDDEIIIALEETEKTAKNEYDFFSIDDEHTEDNEDHLGPMENLELKYDEDDEIIGPDAAREEDPEIIALESEETPQLDHTDGLPDLIAEMEFEFENDDDANSIIDMDEQEAEDSDDIIARAVEQSVAAKEDNERIELTEESGIEFENDSEIPTPGDARKEDEDTVSPVQEEITDVENDENLFNFDDIDLEPDDEIIPLDESDDIAVEKEEEIIEITEFDQHFPEEDEKLLEHAGVLDASATEKEDFLELLEVEDDDRAEDEELMESGDSEEYPEDKENGFENDAAEPIEETPALDPEITMTGEALSSGDEEFDFSLDTVEITQKVDGLDTFLPEDSTIEPEVAFLAGEQPKEDTPAQPDLQASPDTSESLAVNPELLVSAIERVINEKFSDKIENIIYDVIEKAVSKEIDRLKGALLENSTPDDNQ